MSAPAPLHYALSFVTTAACDPGLDWCDGTQDVASVTCPACLAIDQAVTR